MPRAARARGHGGGRETVGKSGRALLPVVFMGLVFVYWFALVGFLALPNTFQFRSPEVTRPPRVCVCVRACVRGCVRVFVCV